MGLFSLNSGPRKTLNWIDLNDESQLMDIFDSSSIKPILFFKHSTRCSVSSMAFSRFEQEWDASSDLCDMYYLDLLEYRPISNQIAEISGVFHQSPQVIVIKNGQVVYSASHSSIDAEQIRALLQ